MTASTRKFPGIPAYSVREDGKTLGVVRQRDGAWFAVAGHDRLGGFPTKRAAVAAVTANREAAS